LSPQAATILTAVVTAGRLINSSGVPDALLLVLASLGAIFNMYQTRGDVFAAARDLEADICIIVEQAHAVVMATCSCACLAKARPMSGLPINVAFVVVPCCVAVATTTTYQGRRATTLPPILLKTGDIVTMAFDQVMEHGIPQALEVVVTACWGAMAISDHVAHLLGACRDRLVEVTTIIDRTDVSCMTRALAYGFLVHGVLPTSVGDGSCLDLLTPARIANFVEYLWHCTTTDDEPVAAALLWSWCRITRRAPSAEILRQWIAIALEAGMINAIVRFSVVCGVRMTRFYAMGMALPSMFLIACTALLTVQSDVARMVHLGHEAHVFVDDAVKKALTIEALSPDYFTVLELPQGAAERRHLLTKAREFLADARVFPDALSPRVWAKVVETLPTIDGIADDSCAICMEALTHHDVHGAVVKFGCHAMHQRCLVSTLTLGFRKCPLCSTEVGVALLAASDTVRGVGKSVNYANPADAAPVVSPATTPVPAPEAEGADA
jgi:hypothetical protein